MTAHETTPSDAAIGQAFREWASDPALHGDDIFSREEIITLAREIEQGRGAVAELPPKCDRVYVAEFDGMSDVSVLRRAMDDYYTAEDMRAYGEACRLNQPVSGNEWTLSHTQISLESAPVEVGQRAPGPTTYVRRDYWVAKLGRVTESKFTSYELAKTHVPSLPPHGESR